MIIKKLLLGGSLAAILAVTIPSSSAMENTDILSNELHKNASEHKLLSLTEILQNLDNETIPLKDRLNFYNPNKMINDVSYHLSTPLTSSASQSDLFLTGVFAIHFHILMAGELPQSLPQFLTIVTDVKGLAKNLGLSVQHRKELQRLKDIKQVNLEKGILSQLFSNSTPETKNKKSIIPNKIKAIEAEIRKQPHFKGAKNGAVFSFDQIKGDMKLLDLALCFGSSAALELCYARGCSKLENMDQEQGKLWLLKAADKDHIESMFLLGATLVTGGNVNAGKSWLEKAANKDHEAATYHLIDIAHQENDDVSRHHWLLKGAESGNISAMYNLGVCYAKSGDNTNAIRWLEEARKNGYHNANFSLGTIYKIEGKTDLAIIAFKRAANKDDIEAMFDLGLLYNEIGDIANAKIWFQKIGKRDARALNNLAALLFNEGNYAEVIQLLKEALKLGDQNALVNLAVFSVKEGRTHEAKLILEPEAKKGKLTAMISLGVCYVNENDITSAKYWYERAANQGDVVAIYNLGILMCFYTNEPEGKKWLHMAAEKGHTAALFILGYVAQGQGDIEAAIKYYKEAYAKGDNKALIKLAEIAETKGNDQSAIDFCKEAIELGVIDAEIYLARLLNKCGLHKEAIEYQEFYEEHNAALAEADETQTSFLENGDDLSSSPQLQEKVSTEIPKKLQRYLDRAKIREKKKLTEQSTSFNQEIKPKTYKDVRVELSYAAQADFNGEHAYKIKNLISALANGDTKRGRFKQLKGYENLYSMRLTQGDRLIFKITKGNLKNGVTGLEIISAKGHYKGL